MRQNRAMIKVLGLALYGPLAASHRYRLLQYQPGLADSGIDMEVHSLLNDAYLSSRFAGEQLPLLSILKSGFQRLAHLVIQGKYDCAIIHCELFPLLPGWIESRLLRVPYIYDFDDAFYLKYKSKRFRVVSSLLGEKFNMVIRRASAVTAGSQVLKNYASPLNQNTIVLPTVVDTNRYLQNPVNKKNVFTVGWIGSPSTSPYLDQLIAPLSRLGQERPVRFIIIGGKVLSIPNVEVVAIPWSEDSEITLINTFNVGVMPLPNDNWAQGKCAFKLIQYMACGVPVIASPVGANRDVLNESCGFFAESEEEWLKALRFIRDNLEKREIMGKNARERIVNEYSLQQNVPLMVDTIKSVCGV